MDEEEDENMTTNSENAKNIATITNADLAVSLARVEERIGAMTEDIKDIKEVLTGSNGRPGLLERTVILEQKTISDGLRIVSLEQKTQKSGDASGLSTKALMGLVGAISGLVTIVGQLVSKLLL